MGERKSKKHCDMALLFIVVLLVETRLARALARRKESATNGERGGIDKTKRQNRAPLLLRYLPSSNDDLSQT